MNNQVELIKAEIKRRIEINKYADTPGYLKEDEALLQFINSLPQEPNEEEKCNKLLEKFKEVVANKSTEELSNLFDEEETASEELEESANNYADKHSFRVPYDGTNNFYDDVDAKASKEGFIAGANWQKEQMMKDAVEVRIVNCANAANESLSICGRYFSCIGLFREDMYCPTVGDKVKLIIIKED